MRHPTFAMMYKLVNGSYEESAFDVLHFPTKNGRPSKVTAAIDASRWCREHGYDGYRLCVRTPSEPFYLNACVQPPLNEEMCVAFRPHRK